MSAADPHGLLAAAGLAPDVDSDERGYPEPEQWPDHPWTCPDGTLVAAAASPEAVWLAHRDGLVGASEVAKMLGLGPRSYGAAFSLWAAKTGRLVRTPTTDAQRRGQVLEAAVLDLWLERFAPFPIKARRAGLMRSREYPHLGATVDRLSVCRMGWPERGPHRCLVEIKTQVDMSEWLAEADPDTGLSRADAEVPLAYQLQGQAQLAVTGRDHVHYVVMGPRFIPEHRVIERDEALIAEIGTRVEAWWARHVVDDEAPAPVGADHDAITRTFTRSAVGAGEPYTIGPDDEPHVHAMLGAAKDAADAKERLDTAKAILQTRMGDRTELVWPGEDGATVATWRAEATIDGVNADFRKAYPDLVERYTVPTTEVDKRKMIENEPWLLERRVLRRRRTFKVKP